MTNNKPLSPETVAVACQPSSFTGQHHILHVYDSEFAFMESLQCFVTCGLRAGEGVVLFATARHLQDLQIRLQASHLQLDRASWQGRYIPVVANEALSEFMIQGSPDETGFKKMVGGYLDRAQAGGRTVRAFAEMVGLLHAQGEIRAAARLERLWNECCRERELTLLCAYPRSSFPALSPDALRAVCGQHDWILDAHARVESKAISRAPRAPPAGDGPRNRERGRVDYRRRLATGFDEAIAFDLARDEAIAAHTSLPRGAKSAAAWSIPGTAHSETGTRWVLRPAH